MTADPSFFEIGVPSGGRAREFYAGLFGWTFDEMGGDNFAIATPGIGGGLHSDDPDAILVLYIAVPDIEAAARRVRELGGHAPEPGPDNERFGRFVECRDNQGVRFGLRQLPRRKGDQ